VTNKRNKQTTFRYTVCRSHEFEIDNQGMWAHMSDFAIASFLYFVKKKFGEKLRIIKLFWVNFTTFAE
jgi:hypothetical protein